MQNDIRPPRQNKVKRFEPLTPVPTPVEAISTPPRHHDHLTIISVSVASVAVSFLAFASLVAATTIKPQSGSATEAYSDRNHSWRTSSRDAAARRQESQASPLPTPKTTTTPIKPTTPVANLDPVKVAAGLIAARRPAAPAPTTTPSAIAGNDLTDPVKKDIAMQLVSSSENSSLNWRAQYAYIEDIGDGRGYTGGIIGFTSGTHDMLEVVQYYNSIAPGNVLGKYIPALQQVDGSASHTGLGAAFEADWRTAALDGKFREAQDYERDRTYFNPAVSQAKTDGLNALGQFIYYDAIVMHGPGTDPVSFGGIRATAMKKAKLPSAGGDQVAYLNAFLDARKAAMLTEAAHDDTDRVDFMQRAFLLQGNLGLNPPLVWKTYGDPYSIN